MERVLVRTPSAQLLNKLSEGKYGNIHGDSDEGSISNESQELEVMSKEKEWLTNIEIPFVCKEVKNILESCLEAFSSNIKKKDDSAIIKQSQLIIESPDGSIRGQIKIEGWNILEGEIVVKSPKWNKSVPFKTNITTNNPWKLGQMYNMYNSVKCAYQGLRDMEDTCKGGEFGSLIKIMDQVSARLQAVMEEMFPSHPSGFPKNKISHLNLNVFQPPLPSDLDIDFSIMNLQFITSVHLLHTLITSPNKMSIESGEKLGRVCQYRRTGEPYWVEIVDQIQIPFILEILKEIFPRICSAFNLCAELRDKMIIFM